MPSQPLTRRADAAGNLDPLGDFCSTCGNCVGSARVCACTARIESKPAPYPVVPSFEYLIREVSERYGVTPDSPATDVYDAAEDAIADAWNRHLGSREYQTLTRAAAAFTDRFLA